MSKVSKCIFLCAICFALISLGGQSQAGFFDDLTKAAGQVADQVSKDAKSVGKAIGVVDTKPKSAKLPGGVANRLKKINQELDRAEKALQKGAGTSQDRARRAGAFVKKAERLKGEIEKRYQGKYDPEHPDVVQCYGRLDETKQNIAEAGSAADKAAADAKEKAQADKAAAASAAAQAEADQKKQKQQKAQASQDAQATCDGWKKRLEQYTQGDKPLHVYPTDDAALVNKWKGYYDGAKADREELDASGLDKSKCFGLESTEKLLATYMERFEDVWEKFQAGQVKKGDIIFSKKPINPASPSGLTDSFQAGDYIYALVQTDKPLSKYYGKKGDLMIKVKLGGQKIHAQFIRLEKPEDLAKNYAILEIAPDPASMLSYTGKIPSYGKSSANMLQGPMELTHHLAKLGPGEHTMEFSVASYGMKFSSSFTIEGSDFGFYAKLNQKMVAAASNTVVMPKARMIDKALQTKMRALLENAGWDNVYRLNIKDKDWWIERVSGGNSAVKSRYLNVAAMRKDSQGYFYQICVFHQNRLITGGWGKLYLSHQGAKVRVQEANKDK